MGGTFPRLVPELWQLFQLIPSGVTDAGAAVPVFDPSCAVLAHSSVTSLVICGALGSRAVPMALRKANRACESYCSWLAGLPAAALAAFGSQYSVDRPSIGMVAHNFALC